MKAIITLDYNWNYEVSNYFAKCNLCDKEIIDVIQMNTNTFEHALECTPDERNKIIRDLLNKNNLKN